MISSKTEPVCTRIEELIFDENKIVSCSWLSKTLRLHPNLSKQLLQEFVQNCHKKEELSITYLVMGLSKDGASSQLSIVKEKDLEDLERDLKKITSKHIYSVQKCLDLTDLNVLYTAQKEESIGIIPKEISAIDYNCNERNNEVLNQLKLNALPKLSTQAKLANNMGSTSAKTTKSSTNNIVDDSNGVNSSRMNKEPSPEKKNPIHQMFKNSVAAKKKNEKVSGNIQKTGAIGSFFSKTAKPSDEKPKLASAEKLSTEENLVLPAKERISPTKENKATLNFSNENTSDKSKELLSTSKKDNLKTNSMKNKGGTKKSKKKIAKKDTEDKKRKRLVVLSDSESNNSEADDVEIEREPTPEPQPSFLPDECDDDVVLGTPEPSKKRKKKLVSKSFTSPDGFLMTEKVYVSCSEEEEEEAPLKKLKVDPLEGKSCTKELANPSENTKIKPSSKKVVAKTKNSSPQKVKQSSLMSFFTKK